MSLELVRQTVAAVDKQIATTKYPGIIYPQCVTINSDIPVGVRRSIHMGSAVAGDFEAGIITSNVNALPEVDVSFNASENHLVDWVETVRYNQLEIEQAKALGIQLDTQKLLELDRFANQGLQKVAFLGLKKGVALTGLLNNAGVKVVKPDQVKSKALSALEFSEAVGFFESLLLSALEQTNGIQAPDTLLLDASDIAALSFKLNANNNVSALDMVQKLLDGAAGQHVNIRAIPAGFAKGITTKKTRAVLYTNSAQDVVFDVPMSPQTLSPFQTNSLEYETGIRMVFGGVVWKNPASAVYVDY